MIIHGTTLWYKYKKIKFEEDIVKCDEKGPLEAHAVVFWAAVEHIVDYLVYCRRAACRCTSCRQWTTRPLLLSRPIEYTTKTAAWACDKTQGVTKRTADTCDNCSSSFNLAAVRSFCFCCHYHWVFVYAKTKTVADLPLALESSCTKKVNRHVGRDQLLQLWHLASFPEIIFIERGVGCGGEDGVSRWDRQVPQSFHQKKN